MCSQGTINRRKPQVVVQNVSCGTWLGTELQCRCSGKRDKHYSVQYSCTIIQNATCIHIESIMIAVLRPVREN